MFNFVYTRQVQELSKVLRNVSKVMTMIYFQNLYTNFMEQSAEHFVRMAREPLLEKIWKIYIAKRIC
jgi:hypothetical protein